MAVEIYTKNPEDDNDFRPDIVDITDEKDIYLNQIRNVFSATTGAVMGAADMGVQLDHLVFETNLNAKQLERRILEQIYKYCPLNYKFKTNVTVKFSKGVKRDQAIIDVFVNDARRLQIQIF